VYTFRNRRFLLLSIRALKNLSETLYLFLPIEVANINLDTYGFKGVAGNRNVYLDSREKKRLAVRKPTAPLTTYPILHLITLVEYIGIYRAEWSDLVWYGRKVSLAPTGP